MSIPKNYVSIYNPKSIHLINGDFPSDNTNEMLIPDFYALSLSDNIDAIIEKKVKLDVLDDHLEKKQKLYKVVGIYQSNYENNISSIAKFYLGHRERSEEVLALIKSEEGYQNEKNLYLSDYGTVKNSLYEDIETYIRAIGTAKGDMLIKLNSPSDSENVSDKLKVIFPNLKFLSKSEMENGDFKASYNSLWNIGNIAKDV